jgi:hypothetical protein
MARIFFDAPKRIKSIRFFFPKTLDQIPGRIFDVFVYFEWLVAIFSIQFKGIFQATMGFQSQIYYPMVSGVSNDLFQQLLRYSTAPIHFLYQKKIDKGSVIRF